MKECPQRTQYSEFKFPLSEWKGKANIVFSLYEIDIPRFFYNEKGKNKANTDEIITFELVRLSYSEKIDCFKECDLENYNPIRDSLKRILKHLNIDCIKGFKSKQDLTKIKGNTPLLSRFDNELKDVIKKLKIGNVKGYETTVSLLYFCTLMTNINRRRITQDELVRFILDDTDGLLEKVRIPLLLPTDSKQAIRIIKIIIIGEESDETRGHIPSERYGKELVNYELVDNPYLFQPIAGKKTDHSKRLGYAHYWF